MFSFFSVPSSSPEIINQSFVSNRNNLSNLSNHSVTIYWKDLPDYEKNGPSFSYLICFAKHNNSWRNFTTIFTNYTFIDLDVHSSYFFKLYSLNSEGLSANHSTFYLPPFQEIMLYKTDLKVYLLNESEEISEYKFKWTNLKNSNLNYTLFFCEISSSKDCIGNIDWEHVTNDNITLSFVNRELKFGLAINNQTKTSGISWTDCFIDKHNRIIERVNSNWSEKNSTSILVKWEFACDAQKELINSKSFSINYCPIIKKTDRCNHDTITVNGAETEFTLTNLKPNTEYKIMVTSDQIKEKINPIFVTTDLEQPLSPENLTLELYEEKFILIRWRFPHDMSIVRFYVEFNNENKNISLDKFCKNNSCLYYISYPQNLIAFKKYTIFVSSCNKRFCSIKKTVSFKTKIAAPGKMEQPSVNWTSSSIIYVPFKHPPVPNGPIDGYSVRLQDSKNNTISEKEYNETKSATIQIDDCNNSLNDEEIRLLSVRAFNFVNTTYKLNGSYSDPISIPLKCKSNITKFFYLTLSLITLGIILLMIYFAWRYWRKAQKKNEHFTFQIKCHNLDEQKKFENLDEIEPKIIPQNNFVANKKISNSMTNTSMISDSSSAEHSHSTDKNYSSTDNIYSSDSGVNEAISKENREYYVNDCDNTASEDLSSKPFLNKEEQSQPTSFSKQSNGLHNKSDSDHYSSFIQFTPAPVKNSKGYVPLSVVENGLPRNHVNSTNFSATRV